MNLFSIIAYLMKYKRMGLKDAYVYVKSQRSIVSFNPKFIEQLIAFELKIFGENSVKMVEIPKTNRKIPDFIIEEFPDLFKKDSEGTTLEQSTEAYSSIISD